MFPLPHPGLMSSVLVVTVPNRRRLGLVKVISIQLLLCPTGVDSVLLMLSVYSCMCIGGKRRKGADAGADKGS